VGNFEGAEKRNSNFELLRIIVMIMITFNHIASLGKTVTNTLDSNTILSLFFLLGGKFGCNVFVILGSWFLADLDFKMSRVAAIWKQTFVYQAVLYGIDVCFFHVELTALEIFRNTSVLASHYWYPRAYICMLFAAPVIKKVYAFLGYKKSSILVVMGGIVLSIIPTVTFEGTLFGKAGLAVKSVLFGPVLFGPIWFSYLFALTYYIKKYIHTEKITRRCAGFTFVFCYLFMFAVEVFLYAGGAQGVGNNHTSFKSMYHAIRNLESTPCVLAAFALFFLFRTFQLNNGIVNRLSGVFGVYLLQCHDASVKIIWKQIFPLRQWRENGTVVFMLYCIWTVTVIMVIGIVSERLYKKWVTVQSQAKF